MEWEEGSTLELRLKEVGLGKAKRKGELVGRSRTRRRGDRVAERERWVELELNARFVFVSWRRRRCLGTSSS